MTPDQCRELDRDPVKYLSARFSGVGPKVADCVALFGWQRHSVVPIDTHMWQIARRHYVAHSDMPAPLAKALVEQPKPSSKAHYRQLSAFFRQLWGEYAGWAHSILFTADLPQFSAAATVPVGKKRKRKRVETN